jgi:hypothetical protein
MGTIIAHFFILTANQALISCMECKHSTISSPTHGTSKRTHPVTMTTTINAQLFLLVYNAPRTQQQL